MGVCCCGRSPVAKTKDHSNKASDAYNDDALPALNPFSDPVLPAQRTGLHTPTKDDLDSSAAAGEGGSADNDSLDSAEAYMLAHGGRRRGAICGETLSPYLKDVRWWARDKKSDEQQQRSDVPEDLQRERDVVRQVLRVHPFFASCQNDASLLEEMLDVFERRTTRAGEVIAAPGDVTAFHVVVRGGAVAAPPLAGVNETRPLQSASSAAAAAALGNAEKEKVEVGLTHHQTGHGVRSSSGRWHVGEAFGDEGLLYPLPQSYSGASVFAEGARGRQDGEENASETVTWSLSRVRYQQLLRLHHDDQLRRVLRLLAQCSLFADLSPEQLFKLAERATVANYDAATPLLRTGETPQDLVVVMTGTVAVEHERANGFGGTAHIQAAILSPGDCVGDMEWLCSNSEAQRGVARPSVYAYTTQQPCEAVRLSLRDVADLLSAKDVAAMHKSSRNVGAAGLWHTRVRQSLRALVEQSLLARISDSDGDTDSSGEEEEEGHHTGAGRQQLLGACASSAALRLPGVRAPLSDEDVTVKGADVTNFLLAQFFARPTYRHADGRERGLSMASFTARRSYPCGTVLFDVRYTIHGGAAGGVRRGSVASVTRDGEDDAAAAEDGALCAKADRLYVVVAGEVTVVDAQRNNACIFVVRRGGSVGEEGLLPPLRCSTGGPLHTRTVVTSEGGCEVYELRAKTFREFLRRPYTAGIRHFCGVFCVLPYAEYFPENYWRFLSHCAVEKEVVGGDLVGVCGAPCASVALLLDGQVKAYRKAEHSTDMNSNTGVEDSTQPSVASFERGDIVGAGRRWRGRCCRSPTSVSAARGFLVCRPSPLRVCSGQRCRTCRRCGRSQKYAAVR